MTIHVNIGEAKTRLSELIAAALRGQDIIVSKAGDPQVRLVPVAERDAEERAERHRKRLAAFGMYAQPGYTAPDIRALKPSDDEIDAHYKAKFGG